MKPIKLEIFQGHIVLLCKNHYKYDNFFEALKRICAVRCGYNYKLTDSSTLIYMANDMYNIIAKCNPEKLPYLMEIIHREVGNQAFYKPENMSPIEALIWEYRSIIATTKVKKLINNKHKTLIELPKPQVRLFNRILRGNGKYEDYYKIINHQNQ